MKKNGLAVFKMERDDFKITLKTADATGHQMVTYSGSQPTTDPSPAAPAAVPAPASDLREILSPMVGTFYASPSPEADAFVSVGSTVSADSVVCIVEAMKVMNEIKAEIAGTVVEVCAENGKPVQFGQVLFRVK